MARQIVVEIVGDARKFSGTLTEATGKAEGFRAKLTNVGKGLAIGAGVAGFNLLTTAIDTTVSKLDEMHQAFLADQESQLRLQNILKNTVKNYDAAVSSAEDFAAAQQKLGFEDDSVRDSLGQLVGITHDLQKAQELSTVAMDLARAKNISLAQATDTVARAYTGVARGLTLVGIDARGASTGLELVNRIAQNTKGAAETYARSGAGRMAAANAKLQDTMEKVGGAIDKVSQIVIPVMVAGLGGIVDAMGEVIRVGSDLVDWVTRNAIPVFDNLANAIAQAGGMLSGFLSNFGLVGDIAKNIDSVIGGRPSTTPTTGGVHSINIGIPITKHHSGGVVPGTPGSDVLAILQAGETVTPAGRSASQIININIASFIGSDRDIDRFSDRLAFRLRSTSLS